MSANPKYSALRLTGATAIVIKNNTPGTVGSININKPIQGVITLLDGTSVVATLASGTGSPIGPQLLGPWAFASLRVNMTSNSEDVTFLYE
jgi:hypothetical protein